MALFKPKCHFGFSPVPAEAPIFAVFGDFVWSQKVTFSKTGSINEMPFLPSENK